MGTISKTVSKDMTLMWNDCKNKLTMPLTKESNVCTFNLAPGYSKYDGFCCMMAEDEQDLKKKPIINTESMSNNNNNPSFTDDEKWSGRMEKQSPLQGSNSIKMDWDLNDKNIEKINELYPDDDVHLSNTSSDQGSTPSQFLKIYQRFGHISFGKLQIMAKKGVIPKNYATYNIPICQAYAYAKIIK